MEENNIYSERIRAGKRTYFIDVKKAQQEDAYYLIVSEKRKVFEDNGSFSFVKSKIFVYPEDLNRFSEVLTKAIAQMKKVVPSEVFTKFARNNEKDSIR